MVRRWGRLVGVTPLVLGMMVAVPQMVVTPLVLAQSSQTNQSSESSQATEAQRLYEEGETLRERGTRGSLQQALDKFQQALPLFRAARDRNGEADNLDSIGRVYNSLGRLQQPPDSLQQDLALDYLQQALPIWREVGNRRGEAITLDYIGSVYSSINQPQQALNFYQQALAIFREVGDRSREVSTLTNIGSTYSNIGQSQQALNYYQQALSISSTDAQSLYNEGERLRQLGTTESFQQALDKFQQALLLFRVMGDRNGEADALDSIGRVYGSRQQALDYLQQALAIWREVGNRRGEAKTLKNIGDRYHFIQPQQALNYYQQALQISREIGDRSGEANTLISIGNLYSTIGQPQLGLNFLRQALTITREVGDQNREARILSIIGNVFTLTLGQPQDGLTYYQQALQIFRELGDRYWEVFILGSIGDAYSGIGQPQDALNYYQQALKISREVGDSSEERSRQRTGEASILYGIGTAYSRIGQQQEALNFLQQALPIWREVEDRDWESLTLMYIGIVYSEIGQPQQALNFLQQSLAIWRNAGTLSILASVHQALNDRPAALQNIQAAISIVEDIRGQLIDPDARTSYFASVQKYYKLQVDLLMELHQQNPNQSYNIQAFNVTERSKARTLLELLTESRADIRTGVDPQLLQQERDIQTQLTALDKRRIDLANSRTNNNKDQITQQITALETQRAALQTQYRNLQSQIRQTSPKYAALKYPQPLTLEQIQQQILDDNTVILSYSLGKDRSYLWLISKTEMSSYQLPAGKILEDLVNQKVRPQFTNPGNRADFLSATSELSNILLKPVLEKTPTERSRSIGNKRIVIISDGALQYLPFGALPDPRADNNQYQPLLVNNEVVYLPSASTLQTIRNETQGRNPAPKTLAVLADPVFAANDQRVSRSVTTTNPNELPIAAQNLATAARNARGSWNRLPGTRQEANTILNLVPENSRVAYFDFQANRANAQSNQLSQYRFIHWATHGFANAQKPELSGVVMSLVQENGQQQDGYLLLGDIFNLNFNADLVVLSACETGLGEVVQGEGLIGLTRGLMYAGTPRVVTSLWSVPDAETATLMGKFYEKMLQNNLRPAEALRAAQLELFRSRSWVSPYYWAAFTLQGEWR